MSGTIRLEYYSWLAKELIGAGEEGKTVELAVPPDGTVRDLLARLAGESPKFEELVYDRADRRLREYATLIVNGRVVELAGGLDRPLQPGDELLLLPGFSGGSGAWPGGSPQPKESTDARLLLAAHLNHLP